MVTLTWFDTSFLERLVYSSEFYTERALCTRPTQKLRDDTPK